MISLTAIFIILITHWIGDFIFQRDYDTKNKSTSNRSLTTHVSTYLIAWIIPFFILLFCGVFTNSESEYNKLLLQLYPGLYITGICHWITDYFTSRLNTKLYKKGDVHNFFVSIGFDQILHYIQLFLTYYYLIK